MSYFDRLLDSNISPPIYVEYTKKLEDSLTKASKATSTTLDHRKQYLAIHKELAGAYQKYSDLRKQHNILKIEDQLNDFNRLFDESPAFQTFIGSRFDHMFGTPLPLPFLSPSFSL